MFDDCSCIRCKVILFLNEIAVVTPVRSSKSKKDSFERIYMTQEHPHIGTGIWIHKDGKFLLGTRTKEGDGFGAWCPPGGSLDMFETIEECVIRETREEASIEIENVRFVTFHENIQPEIDFHYVTFVYVADWKSGIPLPQKSEVGEWGWFAWDALPEPLFKPTRKFVDMKMNPLEYKR